MVSKAGLEESVAHAIELGAQEERGVINDFKLLLRSKDCDAITES